MPLLRGVVLAHPAPRGGIFHPVLVGGVELVVAVGVLLLLLLLVGSTPLVRG